jgi:hypothetical protein
VLVRIGQEMINGGNPDYYIELLEKFNWLLEEEFQDLIKGFDWEEVTMEDEDEDTKER